MNSYRIGVGMTLQSYIFSTPMIFLSYESNMYTLLLGKKYYYVVYYLHSGSLGKYVLEENNLTINLVTNL